MYINMVHIYSIQITKKVWNYITQFAEFNRFTNSPVANYKGEIYSLPFNMYTFNKMWGVVTPEEAKAKIEEQRKEITKRAGESGRTGNFPGWKRHLRKADQGIYGEAVGT